MMSSNLHVIRGDADARASVVLRSADLTRHLLPLVAAMRNNSSHAPWIVVAGTQEAFDAIESACRFRTYSDDVDAGESLADSFPINELRTFAVSTVDDHDAPAVAIEADAPVHRGWFGAELDQWATHLANEFSDEVHHELDDSMLWNRTDNGRGEVWSEQVLGWDDIFDDGQWKTLKNLGPVFFRLRCHGGDLTSERLTAVANVILSASTAGTDGMDEIFGPFTPSERQRLDFMRSRGIDVSAPPATLVRQDSAPDFDEIRSHYTEEAEAAENARIEERRGGL